MVVSLCKKGLREDEAVDSETDDDPPVQKQHKTL